jgi:septal ring factor EnvC (AmiA/AmiB activator)
VTSEITTSTVGTQSSAESTPALTSGSTRTQQALARNNIQEKLITSESVSQQLNNAPAMSGLKPNSGKWPIAGKPLNVFGAKGEKGQAWRGLLISGKQDEPVGSIEAGKVIFAQPLRGYGNMIIVDHGQQYMSIYGYNDQLTKGVGDMVKKGEKIATVGKSGPIDTSALYFEVRQNGTAINPTLFLK